MTETKAPDLLPCPFCGGEPEKIDITGSYEPANIGGYAIQCKKCRASGAVFFGERDGQDEACNARHGLIWTPGREAEVRRVAFEEAAQEIDGLKELLLSQFEALDVSKEAAAYRIAADAIRAKIDTPPSPPAQDEKVERLTAENARLREALAEGGKNA